jgi:hypothetical protein
VNPAAERDPAREGARATLLVLLGGMGLVLLSLHLLVLLVVPPGPAAAALRASLDPARSGSLPDLWSLAQLALAGIALPLLGARSGARPWLAAGLVPAALLVADGGDLASRLAPALAAAGCGALLGKLVAGIVAGGLALVPAFLTWRDSCLRRRAVGRRLVLLLLLGGAASLGLDLLGGWLRGLDAHEPVLRLLAAMEESAELVLYTLVASLLLGQALDEVRRRAIGPVLVRIG